MKHILFLVMLLTLAVPFTANAEVFINRNKDKAQSESQSKIAPIAPRQVTPNTTDAPDSKTSPTTNDSPASIKEFANAYYKNCQKQEHPILKGKNLDMLCACSSAKIAENMTLQNVQVMQENTPEGQKQRNRLMMEAYVPCMQYPLESLITTQCINDGGIDQVMKNSRQVCNCMGSSVAEYIAREAPNEIKQTLAVNPNSPDPLAEFLSSPKFNQQSKTYLLSCLTKHAFGGP